VLTAKVQPFSVSRLFPGQPLSFPLAVSHNQTQEALPQDPFRTTSDVVSPLIQGYSSPVRFLLRASSRSGAALFKQDCEQEPRILKSFPYILLDAIKTYPVFH